MDSQTPEFLPYQRARFATQLPLRYLYTPSHFWLDQQTDGTWRVGMTKFATRMLGEMVDHGFGVEPETPVAPGQIVGWVEGFKAISDLYCVAEGRFAGGNAALKADIALVNKDPYGAGWLYAVRGHPDAQCVDAEGYARALDKLIDRMMAEQD